MQSNAPSLPAALRYAWRPHPHGEAAEPLARAWLADALGCAPAAVALGRDALGRPQLGAPQAGFDVSWSHSGEGLLIALGEGVQVGIDLERHRPRPRALALAGRFFARAEADWLASLPPDTRETAFVRLWCAKEAVLKAHGRGLAFGLDKLVFVMQDGALRLVECAHTLGLPGDWSLHEFAPQPGYRAALAWRDTPPASA
jgi:4'-phosphopantetheinyl transferase